MREDFYYLIYKLAYGKTAIFTRISLFPILVFLFLFAIGEELYFALLSLFLLNEVFLIIKVRYKEPKLKASAAGNQIDSLLFPARRVLEKAWAGRDFLKQVLEDRSCMVFLKKLELDEREVQDDFLDKEKIISTARRISLKIGSEYVSLPSLFVSFLIESNVAKNSLINKNIKEDDLIKLLIFVKQRFYKRSLQNPWFYGSQLESSRGGVGEGIFDFFVSSWDVEIKKYSRDVTREVLSKKFAPVLIGREKEYQELLTILSKETTNSALLVGEAGVGRTALVKYFSYQAHFGNLRVFELLIDRLLAGVQNQGQLEERMTLLIDDILHSTDAILFIRNIENIFGGGGFGFDASGVLFEYLDAGKVRLIGTTAPSSFESIISKKTDVKKYFEVVRLEEPNETDTISMLLGKLQELEDFYGVQISYLAVREAISLSGAYFPNEFLPGKAIDLLQEAAVRVKTKNKGTVKREDVISLVEERTNILISKPTFNEKKLLLGLEQEIHKRIIDQEEGVGTIAEALRRLRSGFTNKKRPIAVFLFLGPTGVGKTETAKALARVYFGAENEMVRLDMSEYQTQEQIKRILGALPSEEYIPNTLAEQVKTHPFTLLLLDEFEKAHPQLLNIFLQVFDEGRFTDNRGETVSFINTIIIATSNAGSEYIREKIGQSVAIEKLGKELVEYLLKNGIFKPELLNRFDEVVVFRPLSVEDAGEVARLILLEELSNLEDDQIFVNFDNKIVEEIVNKGYNIEFGARNIRRYIENEIEDFLSREILSGKIPKGDKVTLSIDGKGEFVLK